MNLRKAVDLVHAKALRLVRAGWGRPEAIRTATRSVLRDTSISSLDVAAGMGQDTSGPSPAIRTSPDLPAAILVGTGALVVAFGRPQTGALLLGAGWVAHLLRG